MKIIKKVKPSEIVDKESLLHVLGGANNVNAVSGCQCDGDTDDNNVNLSSSCLC